MKKTIIATATILLAGICGQAQTTTKQKPAAQPKIAVAPPALSDSFAKIALHVLIAMRNSDGSTEAAGHIETLLEDMELAQTTPTEQSLTHLFYSLNTLHASRLHPSTLDRIAAEHNPGSGVSIDYVCFDAYQAMLKANDSKTDFSNSPPACLQKTPAEAFLEKTAPARVKNVACLTTAGGDSVAIDKCMKEYLSELKNINCSQVTCQP